MNLLVISQLATFFCEMGNVSNGNTQPIREGKKTFLCLCGGESFKIEQIEFILQPAIPRERKGVC